MKAALKNKLQQKLANSEGFTLLEILVVLTIMGFLIAMVAPRLAGIAGSAVDTVCDTNQSRMIQNMAIWWERTSSYPSNMTNLVEEIKDKEFQIPAISDGKTNNGPETIAAEFNERNHFYIHYLNEYEIKELRGLGITTLLNLNAYDAYDEDGNLKNQEDTPEKYDNTAGTHNDVALAGTVKKAPALEPVDMVKTNTIAVAMVGMGVKTADGTDFEVSTKEVGWGEEDFQGRIVLGFGPENTLITSGLIANAAHCPGGIQNEENVTYNDYNLVLPRLDSTATRMESDGATSVAAIDVDATTDGIQIMAVSYNEGDDEPGDGYSLETNKNNMKVRTITLGAQESFMYATMCPEGHKFPADEGDFWALDLNKDKQIGTAAP